MNLPGDDCAEEKANLYSAATGTTFTRRLLLRGSIQSNKADRRHIRFRAGVAREIDRLCLPRFDSDACMAALLGRDEHGCWLIHPGAEVRRNRRRYRPGTMILETDFECDGGAVRTTDFMPIGLYVQSVIRIVEGLEGTVPVYF
jgi:GH15 family glucan-1,4-alpha-glucosidase